MSGPKLAWTSGAFASLPASAAVLVLQFGWQPPLPPATFDSSHLPLVSHGPYHYGPNGTVYFPSHSFGPNGTMFASSGSNTAVSSVWVPDRPPSSPAAALIMRRRIGEWVLFHQHVRHQLDYARNYSR